MAGFNYRFCRAALPTGGSVKTATLPRQGNSPIKLTDGLWAIFLFLSSCRQLQIQIELQPQTISFRSN
jgi:hypothetical protein